MAATLLYICVLSLIALVTWTGFRFGRRVGGLALAATLTWLTITATLAHSGWFVDFSVTPARLQRVLMPTALVTIVFCLSRAGGRTAAAIPLWLLVGFQAFRIPVE